MNGLNNLKRNKMKQFLASTVVNGNEVRLIKENDRYFIYWEEESKVKAVQEILTPTGKIPSEKSASTKFRKAVESTRYLKFSKL